MILALPCLWADCPDTIAGPFGMDQCFCRGHRAAFDAKWHPKRYRLDKR